VDGPDHLALWAGGRPAPHDAEPGLCGEDLLRLALRRLPARPEGRGRGLGRRCRWGDGGGRTRRRGRRRCCDDALGRIGAGGWV